MCTHFEGSEKPKRGHMENKNFFASGTNKEGQNPSKSPLGFLISLKIKFQNVYTDNHKVPKIHSYKIFGGPGGSKLENYILKNCWVCAQRYLDIILPK